MPHRLVSLGILLFWVFGASALFFRELLPRLLIGTPPDLRAVALASDDSGPTQWAILAVDTTEPMSHRSVGQVKTETSRKQDGWVRMSSHAWFDAGELLRNSPFATAEADRIGIIASYDVDPSGNLDNFRAAVRLADSSKMEMLTIEGHLRDDRLDITARSPISILSWRKSFPYQPRGMIQNTFGPLERMPALQVGQRWKSGVVSPLTGRVEECLVRVTKTEVITWDNNPVETLVVLTEMPPLSARTWVRLDGLVLRQEVPFPHTTLMLERIPREITLDSPTTRARGLR